MIENKTCVTFVNYTNEKDFVNVTGSSSEICNSKVGRRGDQQVMMLLGCNYLGQFLHEFVHLLGSYDIIIYIEHEKHLLNFTGFHHMHIAANRDSFLRKFIWENVDPEKKNRFKKKTKKDELSDFGTDWDYESILHKNAGGYSNNGLNTIETLDSNNMHKIGQRLKLSDGDITRINRMYKCDENQILNH
jgi:Astacin (Peptidase family M12A)